MSIRDENKEKESRFIFLNHFNDLKIKNQIKLNNKYRKHKQ